jgi:hypothetical protein
MSEYLHNQCQVEENATMQKILLIGATLIGAVVLVATPVSVKWSGLPNISNIVLGIDQAQSRVGHPGTAVSVAGVNRRHRRHERREYRRGY